MKKKPLRGGLFDDLAAVPVKKVKKESAKIVKNQKGAIESESVIELDSRERIFCVGQYIEILNIFFRAQEVRITGEISELKRATSGHVYFTVKDKADAGVLDCIIWKRNYELCGVALEVGMEIILSGHANIYPPSGRLSFIADMVELVGEGALKKAYDTLKKKLVSEGVFALERKRSLPDYVQRIGVVTSLKGAVIHDFENNLGKFGFVVNVIDARVEGVQAVIPLLSALRTMHALAADGAIDVLVVIRGGGSLESLQAFNNETLVRAIVDFPVPVIAGIGHDRDVPLAALAADYMTSTPTAAAHMLSKSWIEAYAKIREFANLLNRFPIEMQKTKNEIDGIWNSLCNVFTMALSDARQTIELGTQIVKHNDPSRQLALGYSIARMHGKVIRSIKGLKEKDSIELQLNDGILDTQIQKIHSHGKNEQ